MYRRAESGTFCVPFHYGCFLIPESPSREWLVVEGRGKITGRDDVQKLLFPPLINPHTTHICRLPALLWAEGLLALTAPRAAGGPEPQPVPVLLDVPQFSLR